MTLDDIKAKAERFFEWPSEERRVVTYSSAMLFAWDCVRDFIENEYETQTKEKDS